MRDDARRVVLLLADPASYRFGSFEDAARTLGITPIRGMLRQQPGPPPRAGTIDLIAADFESVMRAVEEIEARYGTLRILAIDDGAVELAARINQQRVEPHNDPAAGLAARNKIVMRQRFAAAGLRTPAWAPFDPSATHVTLYPYPIVIKPAVLNGSRGVMRVNDPTEMSIRSARLTNLLVEEGLEPGASNALWESFIPGIEVALDGLMTGGALTVLAIFDKPDPLDGPFFEETVYVTPSRLPAEIQQAISETAGAMAGAIGLRQGPVHAEMRINEQGVWPLEIASRSIGGQCSSILEFDGASLEAVILRHAFGEPIDLAGRASDSRGVIMIPIPAEGMLRGVSGVDEAEAVANVAGVQITAAINHPIRALPEGASYLGFIFARASTPDAVEEALRQAHACLRFDIAPMLRLVSHS